MSPPLRTKGVAYKELQPEISLLKSNLRKLVRDATTHRILTIRLPGQLATQLYLTKTLCTSRPILPTQDEDFVAPKPST